MHPMWFWVPDVGFCGPKAEDWTNWVMDRSTFARKGTPVEEK